MVKKSGKTKNSKNKSQSVNKKLDRILSVENQLMQEEKRVEQKEENLMLEEKRVESKEKGMDKISETLKREESDLEKLERMETEIKAEVGEHPLARVTLKDITKGLIGAFIGLSVHYTFTYGVEIAKELTMSRATLMFPLTFLVGLLFIYATGFRKISDKRILLYMPIRLLVLYIASLIMSIVVLYIFYPTFGTNFQESYKMVAGVMLAAVVGACTADLLGKE